ncbi:MAG: hypothetical protein QOH53_2490, partial [Ilumatobacteraceae bacterium]
MAQIGDSDAEWSTRLLVTLIGLSAAVDNLVGVDRTRTPLEQQLVEALQTLEPRADALLVTPGDFDLPHLYD